MKNRVFTTGEVATICGVSADTVSRWFDLGQIDGYRLGPGGDRRIPYESLRKFMLSHGIPLERLKKANGVSWSSTMTHIIWTLSPRSSPVTMTTSY